NKSIQWEGPQIQPEIINLDMLTKQYGPSYYLFNQDLLADNLDTFKDSFEKYYSNITLGYSYKTNYMPAVCKLAKRKGVLAEVVTGLEYELVLKICYEGNNIIFNGPLKEENELHKAFDNNSIVHFDSYEEVKILKKYLKENPDRNVRCAL